MYVLQFDENKFFAGKKRNSEFAALISSKFFLCFQNSLADSFDISEDEMVSTKKEKKREFA